MTNLDSRLNTICDLFAANFDAGELGASVSVWVDGQEVLSLAEGVRDKKTQAVWDEETLVPFWSATKALAALCVLTSLDEAGVGLDDRVADVWPEFGQAGKDRVTFRLLLSHQAGLAALDEDADALDHEAVASAIARQRPLWTPGKGHGYHPRTFGYHTDEIVRRLAGGASLADYWRRRFAEPLGLDLWIGLPESEYGRVATLYPGRAGGPARDNEFYRAFQDKGTLSHRAFMSPRGFNAVSDMNRPEALQAGFPANGGVGTARGLGKFYSILAAGGRWEGERHIPQRVLTWLEDAVVSGRDRVLLRETSFSAGVMKDPVDRKGMKMRRLYGPSLRAFGHPGAGGSHAFADPENGFAFAYVMNQMDLGLLPTPRSLRLVRALYA